MSKKMAGIIMLYGVVLAGLGLILNMGTPGRQEGLMMGAVIGGGGLCVAWGIWGWAGHKRRVGAALTGVALALVLLHQTMRAWRGGPGDDEVSLTGRILLAVMFVMTIGLLMYLLHGERPPEFYVTSTERPSDGKGRPNTRG